jgi:hypothetical protein
MTYEVGYRRPPKQYQFKKGQSGNSKGRPKRQATGVDLGATFRKVANETVTVSSDSGPRQVPRWEALFSQLMMLVMSDKPHLLALLFDMREAFGSINTLPPLVISESDSRA